MTFHDKRLGGTTGVSKRLSVARLLLDGAASLSFDQRMSHYKIKGTVASLDEDRAAIAGDAQRVIERVKRGL